MSKHNLSYSKNLTCDMGELVPIGLTEVLPGDQFKHSTSLLLRVSPLNTPVMHPVRVRVHHWFVPHRLVWDDFQTFITGGPDGLDASVLPTITPNTGSGYAVGSLSDYLGIPTGVDDLPHSALPHRGYALIWNEFYRDQDLQTALTIDTTSGPDTTTNVALQNVCWEKDYFTLARPWTQKGDAVTMPLGDKAWVKGIGKLTNVFDGASAQVYESDGTNPTYALNDNKLIDPGSADGQWRVQKNPGGAYPNIYADLANASAADIIDVREAFALQRYAEARSLYGSRYKDYLAYLGVRSSDARLQRPEYLGGGKTTIQFSEVLQTAPTTSGTPTTGVGALMGHGISSMRSNRYRKFFEEHGYVFTLMSVLPRTMYATGLQKHWSYSTKEDFWQKELEHIGQQEILNKEVYWADSAPNDIFGYGNRYDQYRRNESGIAGEFRTTLNTWHYARLFTGDPTLNASFVSADPTKRVNQSTSTDCLWIHAQHNLMSRRLVSRDGVPI